MSKNFATVRGVRIRRICATAALLVSVAVTFGQTPGVPYFQAKYDALVKAYAQKDISTAASILAPDYKAGSGPKALDKAKTLEHLKNSSGVFKTIYRKVSHVGFKNGLAYIVEDSMTSGKTLDAGTNIYHVYVMRQHCIDQWEKVGNNWQLKNVGVSGSYTTKDGKQFRPHSK